MSQRTDTIYKIALVVILVSLAVWSRLIPHPANFTALTAVALLGGALLPKRWGVAVPLAAMIASDLVIGMHALSAVVWVSFALTTIVGSYLKTHLRATNVVLASLAGSTLFYLITNFAVWTQGQMYAMNFSGLVNCYVNALPFFRNMLAGDLIYSGLLFGLYALVAYSVKTLRSFKQVQVNQ